MKPLRGTLPLALMFVPVGAALAWSYAPTLAEIVDRWSNDPSYSHGFLVPLFAAWYLWRRRPVAHASGSDARSSPEALSPSACGALLVAAALGMRLAGAYVHFGWFDQLSLIPCLAGIVWLLGGWTLLRWSLPALAFLFFMIPLPHSLAHALSSPMQTFATHTSTFFLQVLGRPALAEGHVILLNDVELGIVEACSGLRMLVVFFALSTAVAMLIRKPLWERLVVAASAIPIALLTNVVRITATGVLHDTVGSELANAVFHDLAGWLMMPLGLAFLGLELLLFKHLLIEPTRAAPALVQVSHQRVSVDPLALYRQQGSRRQRPADAPLTPSEKPA